MYNFASMAFLRVNLSEYSKLPPIGIPVASLEIFISNLDKSVDM